MFLEFLPSDETMEVFGLHRRLNPEDFENNQFKQFIDYQQQQDWEKIQQQSFDQSSFAEQFKSMMVLNKDQSHNAEKQVKKMLQNKRSPIDGWKNCEWQKLTEWYGDFDIFKYLPFVENRIENLGLFKSETGEKIEQQFELMLAFIFAEFYCGSRNLLRCNEMSRDDQHFAKYITSLQRIKIFIDYLYYEFMQNLSLKQGETTHYYKLFLHVLYEVESAVYFLKDLVFKEKEKILEQLKKDISVSKRRFEKVYYELNLNKQFEKLLSWFEERSTDIQCSHQSLKLVYFVRRAFFALFERETEQAFCSIKIVRLMRKTGDLIEAGQLLKSCEPQKCKIVDFELEVAKYILQHRNAQEAHTYLKTVEQEVEKKCEQNSKQINMYAWMPKLVSQKVQLMMILLRIKINTRDPNIIGQFQEFVKKIKQEKWEKPNFKFAEYLDQLDAQGISTGLSAEDRRKRNIQKIFYYIESLKYGFKYIWQSLPRALELWFEYQGDNEDTKMQNYMRAELQSLESFKIATALQIFLNRFGHKRTDVQETILIVLSKLAFEYPEQSAWWFFHFFFFDDKEKKDGDKKMNRKDFAQQLIKKVIARDKDAGALIMQNEPVFKALKDLAEKASTEKDTTIDIPAYLSKVSQTHLVMPTEENLSPQLPKANFKRICLTKALVDTVQEITDAHPENVDLTRGISCEVSEEIEDIKNYLVNFPAYKANPVMISTFTQKVSIMTSKEKPKKIGVIGTDKQVYNFLLKFDKYGDLRKEQRFIDFAGLCNKMLDNDPEASKRNLRLRTFSIVPLSRNTGMIEWINNTNTLKNVVSDYWKKQNVKGEMTDIKKKAQEMQMGDTHTKIWKTVMQETKPVLGNWLADHYLTPDIWYEARLNFIKSTAIWSMIGYVIGLGDRHGDNILIHQHTGEVTHVDFDCIFEKGAKLKIPEIVPFRLTQNIMDGFGIFREKGVFQKTCEVVLNVLRKNQANIRSYLESFNHDPLVEDSKNLKIEIKEALKIVEKKLQGHMFGTGTEKHLTIDEQVAGVILNAINEESLAAMYIGWMPWL